MIMVMVVRSCSYGYGYDHGDGDDGDGGSCEPTSPADCPVSPTKLCGIRHSSSNLGRKEEVMVKVEVGVRLKAGLGTAVEPDPTHHLAG